MNLEKFKELGLSEAMLKEIKKKGFDEPTEIQEKIIPMLLGGDMDVVGQAQTGTGKTAAFGIPIIEKMEKRTGSVQALVLVPTRELALQVAEELDSLKGKKKLSILAVYGGQSIREQIRELQSGVDIVIGTPGRIQDHINRKTISLSDINFLVLDEADEMLNMGFVDEVELILKETNPGRRTLLFSATMPDSIMKIAKKYMKAYEIMATDRQQVTTNLTDQIYFEVSASDKLEVLCRIMDMEPDFYGLVFCRTKVDTDELVNKLIERGYGADGIHGDLSQTQRERTLDKFKRKRITILVATDVAARGIDVTNMTHVINYALPQDPEVYVHRIGRTGRAGNRGTAITFITPNEYSKLMYIQKIAKTKIRRESVPTAAQIVEAKKARIQSRVQQMILEGEHSDYMKFAGKMLKSGEPEEVLAAVMKYAFEKDLDESRYRDIREIQPGKSGKGEKNPRKTAKDRQEKTRLFMSLGKKDGLDARKLVKLVNNDTKVPGGRIDNVLVMDAFSFFTASATDARIILAAYEGRGERQGLVKKAAEPKETSRDKKKKAKNKSKK